MVEPQVTATIATLKYLRTQAGPHLKQLDETLAKLAAEFGLNVTDTMKHDFQINIREKYVDKLVQNLTERFADSELLSALITLFHPNKASQSTSFEEYGNDAVQPGCCYTFQYNC